MSDTLSDMMTRELYRQLMQQQWQSQWQGQMGVGRSPGFGLPAAAGAVPIPGRAAGAAPAQMPAAMPAPTPGFAPGIDVARNQNLYGTSDPKTLGILGSFGFPLAYDPRLLRRRGAGLYGGSFDGGMGGSDLAENAASDKANNEINS